MGDGRCPKCGSARVHVVDAGGLSIPLSAFSVAPLGLYVCVGCGCAELYVKDKELLPKIAAKYVSVAELNEAGSCLRGGSRAAGIQGDERRRRVE